MVDWAEIKKIKADRKRYKDLLNNRKWEIPSYFDIAKSYVGLREIPGKQNEPRIVEMYKSVLGIAFDDEVPWCAAFVGHCLSMAGLKNTGSLRARSYLLWGKQVDVPMLGDIVVLWRQHRMSEKGHVGFYCGENDTHIYILGGNQNNKVGYNFYPKNRLLSYRRGYVK